MKISVKAWEAYRTKLAEINKKAADLMTQYVTEHGLNDADEIVQYAYSLSTKYGEAASALACQMYDQTAEASGVSVPPAEPAETMSYEETDKVIKDTMEKSVLPQVIGSEVGRLVKQAAADTTLKNAQRDNAQFAWIPSGDGCAFCRMLASNGWRDASNKILKGGHATHIHPNCQCEFAIRFSENDGVEGYDPDKYKQEYYGAEGDSWKEKLRSMEREDYAKNKDVINARKRELYANEHLENN